MKNKCAESVSVCDLSLKKGEKMSKSKRNNRQQASSFVEKSILLQKNLKEPLKCKKNIVHITRSVGKPSNVTESCSVKSNKKQILTPQMLSCYKIDVLSGVSKTVVPQKSPKRTLRSSSKQEIALHFKEITVADEALSQRKSKKKQNISDENTPHAISHKSPNKSKRSSFYRNNLTAQLNHKSEEQKHFFRNEVINAFNLSQESLNETVRSSRRSMKLRSQEHSENNSGSERLVSDLKHHGKSSVIKKQQKAEPQRTLRRRSNKHQPFAEGPKSVPSIKRKYVKKSSAKLQERVRSKSCLASITNIPVDVLALSPIYKRKTKSDGYKLPGRNTLKRKRLIIDAIKKADEDYEDDIYEEKEFKNFENFFPDNSESEMSYLVSTPKLGFQLTPQIRCKTPAYKDCFSPEGYALSRKVAEECLYRQKKRMSNCEVESPGVPEKKKLEFNEIIENACKVQKEVEKLASDENDCEDSYFTDDGI